MKSHHIKGLKAFQEEFPQAKLMAISLDKYPRTMSGVEIIPAKEFLKMLWAGKIL